jgi:outer membrane receptor for ferrienterochelin and colicins
VGSRVLLMVDGVSVITSDLGAVNWRILPLLDVDRIEVVKGAGSALYGSSAMGGVVNIITRAPETKARLIFRLVSGWFDEPAYTEWKWTDKKLHAERAELAFSQRIGGVGLRLGASRSLSTGYMENNELDQWNVSGRLDYALKNGCRIELSASWMKSREGGFIQWINQNQPFKVPPYNKNDELLYSMLNAYAMLHWPVSASFGLRLRASFLQSELGNQLTTFNPGAFDPGRGPGIELQGDWLPHPLHRVTFGTEWRRDLSGSQYFETHTGYSVSPYMQEEWTIIENLKASAGARLDSHVMDDEGNDTRVSPKFGLNFRPRESTSIRFSGGAGFRAATVFEKYITADYSGFNVIPNPDLRPERSWTWDAGVRHAVSDHASLDLSVFQTDYWDMIEPFVNFLGTIQFRNFVRARIRGVEAFCESWWWRRRLGLAAGWCSMDPLNMEQRSDLPYRPRNFGTLTGSVRLGPSLFQAEWRYASRIRSVELNPLDPRVPVKLLSLRGEMRWRSLTFQACVNNVLNYHYTQVERRMGEVRNVNLTIIGKY